jgi:hypothetical protein
MGRKEVVLIATNDTPCLATTTKSITNVRNHSPSKIAQASKMLESSKPIAIFKTSVHNVFKYPCYPYRKPSLSSEQHNFPLCTPNQNVNCRSRCLFHPHVLSRPRVSNRWRFDRCAESVSHLSQSRKRRKCPPLHIYFCPYLYCSLYTAKQYLCVEDVQDSCC